MMLLALVLVPLIVGTLLFALPAAAQTLSRVIGVVASLATVVLVLAARGDDWSVRWLSRPFTAAFHLGLSGLSFWLALLLTVVTLSAIVACNASARRDLIAQLLFLEGTMLGLFLARDLLLFALFWDAMLLPVFFTLLARASHVTTAWRYFLYNFAGGLALLLATAAFGVLFGSTDVIGQAGVHVIGAWAPWILGGFALAFLVKTPVFPLHTWMPLTYADTPPAMVAVVSAVQSKAGLYGFIVIGLAFFPDYMKAYAGIFLVLGAISLIYGALAALAQSDTKRIVAYSSLSHLGLILIAIFSFNTIALQGAGLYLIAHGIFSAALFLVLGFVEEREETRSLTHLGGLGALNPRLAGALCIAALAALGLPGLAGFAGELLIITGIFQSGLLWAALLALIPIVLAAAYMLRLFQGVMNGPQRSDLPIRADLSWREGIALAPLVLALLALGTIPGALLQTVIK